MDVICRQEVFAFCRAKVLQDGEIIVVVYTIIKERRLIILFATFRGLFSSYSLRREIVAHQWFNISVGYRENTANPTQIIGVNSINY